jgi:hypothetical protein
MSEEDEMIEHRVRERAFQLWQEAGCPEGRADEFWRRAREMDLAEAAAGHYPPPTGDTQNFA